MWSCKNIMMGKYLLFNHDYTNQYLSQSHQYAWLWCHVGTFLSPSISKVTNFFISSISHYIATDRVHIFLDHEKMTRQKIWVLVMEFQLAPCVPLLTTFDINDSVTNHMTNLFQNNAPFRCRLPILWHCNLIFW